MFIYLLFLETPLASCASSTSLESPSIASAAATSETDFNFFLLQVASEIKSDELDAMKFLCQGDTLPEKTYELIDNPREMLFALKRSGKIRPGEVMYLVTLLEIVGLVRLAERVKEMGKTSILSLV